MQCGELSGPLTLGQRKFELGNESFGGRTKLLLSTGIFLSGSQRGHCPPPLNFDNPKRSKIWYVVRGVISHRLAVAAKCKSAAIDFWIFLKPFLDVL